MQNRIVKYENKWWLKFFNKIKSYFIKSNDNVEQIESNDIKNDEEQIKKFPESEINNEIQKKYNEKKNEFVKLVIDIESGKITAKDLNIQQLETLIKYYEVENKKLEVEIEQQEKIMKELNLKLNKAYEKAIKLKMV